MRAAKLLCLSGGILLVAVVGVIGYRWTQGPANGVNTSLQTAGTSSVLGSQTKLSSFSADYFTTQLPAQLIVKNRTENAAAPISGSYLLTNATRTRSDQLAITYGQLGNSQLSEIAAVKLRSNHPDQYQPIQFTGTPAGGLAFSRQDSYETSVFWQHGTHYVAVVGSGTADARGDMDEALHAAVSNWQWR